MDELKFNGLNLSPAARTLRRPKSKENDSICVDEPLKLNRLGSTMKLRGRRNYFVAKLELNELILCVKSHKILSGSSKL